MVEAKREVIEVEQVAEVALVVVEARRLVREFNSGGFVGDACRAIEDALCKLDTARNAARAKGGN